LIENKTDWRTYLAITDVLYVQEYLPIEKDLRIVVVGKKVISAYWRLQAPNGFHNNISRGGTLDYGPVPDSAIELVLKVAEHLGIDHAGFDVAMVGNHPFLLEFNRLFGDAGIPGGDQRVREAILQYLTPVTAPLPAIGDLATIPHFSTPL
jgi:ribosomal protein S6--L-glutamate ligase